MAWEVAAGSSPSRRTSIVIMMGLSRKHSTFNGGIHNRHSTGAVDY